MADPNLEPTRRADLASALRTMCRALKTEPESLVANLRDISRRLAKVSPASIGVTPGRWSNVRNLVLAALRLAGIRALPGRYREPLPPAWEALRALLPSDPSKSRVSRLMGFCAANGIAPGAVTEETFALFQSEIENNSLVKRPAAVLHDARLTWNAAADDIPGWPQLRVEVPNRRRDFAYSEEDFPEPFRVSVGDYLTKRANPDVFAEDYCRPMSEITLKHRRQHILVIATALAMSGFPIVNITSLSVVVDPTNAEAALRFLFSRAKGEKTPTVARLAALVVTIAKHHVGLAGKQLDRLRVFARNLRPKSQGFTEKNRAFIRQFADPRKYQALANLPGNLIRRAKRCPTGSRRAAELAAYAVAFQVELVIPPRPDDLTGLIADEHLHCHGKTILISLTAHKSGCTVDAELPAEAAKIIDLYKREYLPRLAGPKSPWLFPGEDGGRRQTGGFAAQLSRIIYSETGIKMTMHQFRHLAAWIYLRAHPGDYETVRRLLGHKNVATTIRFYQEMEKLTASRRYNEIVTELVVEQGFGLSPTGRKKRGTL
jgi:hypothetical protein